MEPSKASNLAELYRIHKLLESVLGEGDKASPHVLMEHRDSVTVVSFDIPTGTLESASELRFNYDLSKAGDDWVLRDATLCSTLGRARNSVQLDQTMAMRLEEYLEARQNLPQAAGMDLRGAPA
jgi:hypothetical protein